MKRTLFAIFICCFATISFAKSSHIPIPSKIIQTDDLQLIKREIFSSPKDTLVVFDVDFVLTTPSDAVFMLAVTDDGEKLLKHIYDDLWERLPKHDIDEMQSILMLTQTLRLVTPDTAKIFNQIKDKGYKILGLTAIGTGGLGKVNSREKWRIDALKSVGITFDKNFINANAGTLDQYIPNVSTYYAGARRASFPAAESGIVFTSVVPKGEVLDAYLQFAKIKPKKIIFIDDIISNLETVRDYCNKSNIQYVGYEYIAIKEQAKSLKLNPRRAKLQYKLLELTKTWLHDAEADTVLNYIDK